MTITSKQGLTLRSKGVIVMPIANDDEDDIDLQRAAMSPATAMPLATCHMMIQT